MKSAELLNETQVNECRIDLDAFNERRIMLKSKFNWLPVDGLYMQRLSTVFHQKYASIAALLTTVREHSMIGKQHEKQTLSIVKFDPSPRFLIASTIPEYRVDLFAVTKSFA